MAQGGKIKEDDEEGELSGSALEEILGDEEEEEGVDDFSKSNAFGEDGDEKGDDRYE